jgi:hypothetical protein
MTDRPALSPEKTSHDSHFKSQICDLKSSHESQKGSDIRTDWLTDHQLQNYLENNKTLYGIRLQSF